MADRINTNGLYEFGAAVAQALVDFINSPAFGSIINLAAKKVALAAVEQQHSEAEPSFYKALSNAASECGRCKDRRYFDVSNNPRSTKGICTYHSRGFNNVYFQPNDFCNYYKRKDN